jgi:hypothetical protein
MARLSVHADAMKPARRGRARRPAEAAGRSSARPAEAMGSQTNRVRRLVTVDAARDEVERAYAPAEIWREDGG